MMNIYLFLFDGFSDWEIGYLTPEINKSAEHRLITFSVTGLAVVSAGGLRIQPEASMRDIKVDNSDMLILPGGEEWEKGRLEDVGQLVSEFQNKGAMIAAICAATTFLAKKNLLRGIQHTGNAREYMLAMAPDYAGREFYIDAPALRDHQIITANGTSPVEFAQEIFRAIKLFPERDLSQWYKLFKLGIWEE